MTADDVNAAMKKYAEGPLKGILGYEPDDLVSMDFVGDPRSSIFAPRHTMVMGDKMVKILSWYDNEWCQQQGDRSGRVYLIKGAVTL